MPDFESHLAGHREWIVAALTGVRIRHHVFTELRSACVNCGVSEDEADTAAQKMLNAFNLVMPKGVDEKTASSAADGIMAIFSDAVKDSKKTDS